MNRYDLIIRPLLTEKSTILRDEKNKVSFVVNRAANRLEVSKAIEEILGVKVKKVNTMNMRGKLKRLNRFVGRRSDWK
ncbi:MAG: 50S ribosomal protein L23, partial [Nitrospiria bacterium]